MIIDRNICANVEMCNTSSNARGLLWGHESSDDARVGYAKQGRIPREIVNVNPGGSELATEQASDGEPVLARLAAYSGPENKMRKTSALGTHYLIVPFLMQSNGSSPTKLLFASSHSLGPEWEKRGLCSCFDCSYPNLVPRISSPTQLNFASPYCFVNLLSLPQRSQINIDQHCI